MTPLALPLVVVAALSIGASKPARAGVSPRRWTDAGSGITFEITAKDFRATRAGKLVYSARQVIGDEVAGFRKDVEDELRELSGEVPAHMAGGGWDISTRIRPMSVVGPIVSVLSGSNVSMAGAAHPNASQSILAMDLARADRSASLLEYWPEPVLVQALARDPWLRELTGGADTTKLATLAALVEALDRGPRPEGTGQDSCRYDVAFDAGGLATAFAFHHLEGGDVAVRIGVGYGSESCRGTMHQIGILLPIPPRLAGVLHAAEDKTGGFLMKDDKRMSIEVSGSWGIDLPAQAE